MRGGSGLECGGMHTIGLCGGVGHLYVPCYGVAIMLQQTGAQPFLIRLLCKG